MQEIDQQEEDQPDLDTPLSKEEKKKQFGEVFTPPELVNEILDQLPPELWSDPTKTWLDNSCGQGAFLLEVKRRLLKGLETWEPDPVAREQHILNNQIFGVELQRDNWMKCRSLLGLAPDGNDGNIVNTDALTYDYSFRKNPNGGYVLTNNTFEELFSF
jgi:type I restriction-modification system DNA methylase subunit